MYSYPLLAAIFIGLSTFSAVYAEDSTRELSKQFVTLMRYSDQYLEYHGQCLAATKSVTPEAMARQNPDRFYGIQPGSKLWSEVVKAYDLYYEQVCERPTQEEFLDALAHAYAVELSPIDLRSAISFYSTPTGQRMITAHRAAARNVFQEQNRLNTQQIPIALDNFNRRMIELSAKAGGK
jgi:uncharacterized protein DUF2059